jgi:hypothetical protein
MAVDVQEWFEIVDTFAKVAVVMGVSVNTVRRYRRTRGGFPPLPTFRAAILRWAEMAEVPLRRGRERGEKGSVVAELRAKGMSFQEIGKALGMAKQTAWRHYKRGMSDRRG